jgi:hypothetical protein
MDGYRRMPSAVVLEAPVVIVENPSSVSIMDNDGDDDDDDDDAYTAQLARLKGPACPLRSTAEHRA